MRPLVPEVQSGYFKREWVKEGIVEQVGTRDDKEFSTGWKRKFHFIAPALAILTLGLYWLYFGLRITFVISAQQKFHAPFPLAWIFIAIEITVAIPIMMHTFWSLFIVRKRRRPKLRLIGNDVPTVDVFITCCNEDDYLVLDTVRAACDLDYPLDRFRVIVLDDGKSEVLRDAVADLNEIYHNVYYIRRIKIKGVPHHFKAGNLNNGLDEVHRLPGGAGEFMAALDADMIPEQSWLRAVMPHLIVDPKMGLACPPQVRPSNILANNIINKISFFITCPPPTLSVKVSTFSSMFPNRSRTPWVSLGAQARVISPEGQHLTTLATFQKDPWQRTLPLLL